MKQIFNKCIEVESPPVTGGVNLGNILKFTT